MITINFWDGKKPLEIDAETVAEAVKKAIKDGADLSRADLNGANLSWADLSGANLSRANLSRANLNWANLSRANLNWANLDYSCWPLWCGSLDVKIDKRIFCQLLYHTLRAGQSIDDPEVAAILKNADVLKLANQFHRVEECGEIGKEESECEA